MANLPDADLIMGKLDAPKVHEAAAELLTLFQMRGLSHSQKLMVLAATFQQIQTDVKHNPVIAREYEKLFCAMTGIVRA